MGRRGFTLVELLIVIVVIAILAAISVVAYNGIVQRANNDKTLTAANAWIKAVKLYKIDKGVYPSQTSCLGEGYKYGPRETDASGAQCRQDLPATNGVQVVEALQTDLGFYAPNNPTPAMITAYSTDTLWKRGMMYYPSGANFRIDFVLQGNIPCPDTAAGKVATRSVSTGNGNTMCHYVVGTTSDG